jgi:hypothetical protein
MKPKIAAFPKGWIRDLVAPDKLSIYEWVDMSQAMGIEGLEMYNNFADFKDEANWPKIRKYVESTGMVIPMMCCSPERWIMRFTASECQPNLVQSIAAFYLVSVAKTLPTSKAWVM